MTTTLEQQTIPKEIGSYRLIERIGKGGFSEVWRAEHRYLANRVVAIKVLMHLHEEERARFVQEAAIAGRLRHPNIVQVFDFCPGPPLDYAVLEYIPGGSLLTLMEEKQRGKGLPVEQAAEIFRQIAGAVGYAHEQGIIHRDLSPGNVLIEQATGRAVLTDFGIARDPTRPITVANSLMGTRGFISPEHTQSATAVTQQSDIFCLGVLFYYMLSGALPWRTIPELTNSNFGEIVPLRERNVERVPAEVERLIAAMLSIDPARRYSSATDTIAHLDAILNRHKIVTQVLKPGQRTVRSGATNFMATGVEDNAVEQYLNPGLIRGPIDQANKRAEELSDPAQIVDLLDAWSAQNRVIRRWPLGRLARLHKASSHNVYFYRVKVLFERRSAPVEVDEPDRAAKPFPVTLETDRWEVALTPPKDFGEDSGKGIEIPGTKRVIECVSCKGKRTIVCPKCHGAQRITIIRPVNQTAAGTPPRPTSPSAASKAPSPVPAKPDAAGGSRPAGSGGATSMGPVPQVEREIVPCPDCNGRGGIVCSHCEGIGRLVRRKTFNWQRTSTELSAHDDLVGIDEDWLRQHCRSEKVYTERQRNGIRPEWTQIPVLRDLVMEIQRRCDAETRIALCEVSVNFIPVTIVLFDLEASETQREAAMVRLPIYGFEKIIPTDWRLLNWERLSFMIALGFLFVVTLIFGVFAFGGI